MNDRFCLSLAILTWAIGLASPGGAVSLAPHPKKSIDVRHRPIVLAQDNGEHDEPQNVIEEWWSGGFSTTRLGNHEIRGNREGQVTVRDLPTGEIVWTFQMPEARVVRTTWLLDGGEVGAASQLNQTVFWNLDTGEEIQVVMHSDDSAILLRDRHEAGSYVGVVVMNEVPDSTDVIFQFFGER